MFKKITAFLFPPKKQRLPAQTSINRSKNLVDDKGQFIFEADGIRYPFKEHESNIKWADIEQITGYKVDLATTDEICMDIFTSDHRYTFTESTASWELLQKKLKDQFPNIPDDWDSKIAHPPFATNYTVLYDKSSKKDAKL